MADISPELAARIEELKAKHDENPAKFFMSLAREYREAGMLGEAEDLLREHLKRHPGYLSAHVLLGGCLADRGARDEARNEFHYVLSIDPQNLIALRTLGEMAAAEGRKDEARRWYNEWLAVDPMSAEARRAVDALDAAPDQPAAAAAGEGWDPFATGEVQAGATGGHEDAADEHFGEVALPDAAAQAEAALDLPPADEHFGEVALPEPGQEPAAASGPPALEDQTEALDLPAWGEIEPAAIPEPAEQSAAEPEPAAAGFGSLELPAEPADFGSFDLPAEPAAAEAAADVPAPAAEFGTIDLDATPEPSEPEPATAGGEWNDFSAASGIDLPADEPFAAAPPLPEPAPEPAAEPEPDVVPADDEAPLGVEEPEVLTETMAELLYGQGHLDRAADVYRELLMRGGDPGIARRLGEIEAEMRGEAGTTPPAGGLVEEWDGRHGVPEAAERLVEADAGPAWLDAVEAVSQGVVEGLTPLGEDVAVQRAHASAAAPRVTVAEYFSALLSWRPGAPAAAQAAPAVAEPQTPAAPEPETDLPFVDRGAAEESAAELPFIDAEPAADLPFLEPEPAAEPAAETVDSGAPPAAMPWDEQTLSAPEEQPPLDEPWMAPAATPAAQDTVSEGPRDPFADSFAHGFEGPETVATAAPPAAAEEEAMPWSAPAAEAPAPPPPAQEEPMPWAAPSAESAAPAPAAEPDEEPMPWATAEPVAESAPAAPATDADAMPWESAAPAAETRAEPAAPPASGGGFSFEDFFGASAAPAPAPAAEPPPAAPATPAPPAAPAEPAAAGGEEDEDLESFQAWLQSLKR